MFTRLSLSLLPMLASKFLPPPAPPRFLPEPPRNLSLRSLLLQGTILCNPTPLPHSPWTQTPCLVTTGKSPSDGPVPLSGETQIPEPDLSHDSRRLDTPSNMGRGQQVPWTPGNNSQPGGGLNCLHGCSPESGTSPNHTHTQTPGPSPKDSIPSHAPPA